MRSLQFFKTHFINNFNVNLSQRLYGFSANI
jgi:hypothetical protein